MSEFGGQYLRDPHENLPLGIAVKLLDLATQVVECVANVAVAERETPIEFLEKFRTPTIGGSGDTILSPI